jgi:hypothetical protein
MAYSLFDAGIQGVASAVTLPGNYRRNKERGMAPAVAALDAVGDAGAGTFLNASTYITATVLRGLTGAAYRGFRNASVNIRQAATPFSHSFRHTQTTSRLQSYGLQKMGAMRGLGSEASQMYGLYGH